jgi:hypothetical protein
MLIQEILPLLGDTTEIVEVGDGTLGELLRVPDGVAHRRFAADDTAKLESGSVVVGFVGPDQEKHSDAESVAPALRLLPVGGRVVLLLGWPIEELPYHVLLGPLVDADCQVLQVAPLEKAFRHGAHCVAIAARVERLAPLRTHLDETPIAVTGEEPSLRALLRLAAEYTFGDIVTRPARRNLVAFRDRNVEQAQRIRELEREVRDRVTTAEKRLAVAERELARVRASAAFQVGATVVQGARKPGTAIVSVPVGLVRVWRRRGRPAVNGQSGPTG